MAQIVIDLVFLKPLAQAAAEELVVEVFASQSAELDAGLVEAAVKVKHAHKPRPLP